MLQPLFWILFSFVLFGSQVGHAKSFQFTIEPVNQCEEVSLKFKGENLQGSAPTALKVLPINGIAYDLPLPPVNVTDQGVTVSFLPIREGTTFIATMDDDTGDNTSKVSDISRVQPGSSSDCLPPDTTPDRNFTLVGQDDQLTQPSQCQEFTVQYDISRTGPPNVRIYSPRVASYELNSTADDGAGTATYMMTAGRGFQYILLFKDTTTGSMETTPLMTVGGDTSSPTECFDGFNFDNNGSDHNADFNNNQGTQGSLNQKTIIGLAIGGSVIALIASVLVAYLIWERRHRRRVSIRFDPSLMEKRTLDPDTPSHQSAVSVTIPSMTGPNTGASLPISGGGGGGLGPKISAYSPPYGLSGFVQNPAYAAASSSSPPLSNRSSVASWGNDKVVVDGTIRNNNNNNINGGTQSFAAVGFPTSRVGGSGGRKYATPSQESMQSFEDIERMLNTQEQRLREEQDEMEGQRNNNQKKTTTTTTSGAGGANSEEDPESPGPSPFSITLSQPVIGVRAIPQRGHLRDPSDIPRAPSTDMLGYDDPFGDDGHGGRTRNTTATLQDMIQNPISSTDSVYLQPPPPIASSGNNRFSNGTSSSFGNVGDLDGGGGGQIVMKNKSGAVAARRSSRIIISGLPLIENEGSVVVVEDDYEEEERPRARKPIGLGRGNGEAR